jgi:hypothetical protein
MGLAIPPGGNPEPTYARGKINRMRRASIERPALNYKQNITHLSAKDT